MQMIKHRKGVIDQLIPLVIGLVVIGIMLVVALLIMSQVAANSQVTADTNATAAIKTVQNAAGTIPAWLPIIVITIIGALLIGLVSIFRGRK